MGMNIVCYIKFQIKFFYYDAKSDQSYSLNNYLTKNYIKKKEILKKIAIETINLKNDPFYLKFSETKIKCKLCLTNHKSDSSYLAHTQGKRHSNNIRIRFNSNVFKISNNNISANDLSKNESLPTLKIIKAFIKTTTQKCIQILICFLELLENSKPDFRVMTTFEQSVESVDINYQFLLISKKDFKTVGLKVPNFKIDYENDFTFTHWFLLF